MSKIVLIFPFCFLRCFLRRKYIMNYFAYFCYILIFQNIHLKYYKENWETPKQYLTLLRNIFSQCFILVKLYANEFNSRSSDIMPTSKAIFEIGTFKWSYWPKFFPHVLNNCKTSNTFNTISLFHVNIGGNELNLNIFKYLKKLMYFKQHK